MKKEDLKTIRIRNLKHLCEKHGRDEVRKTCGYDDTNYFNQIITGHASFGPKTAERIEQAMKRPPGWMSERHPLEWGDIGSMTIEEFNGHVDKLVALANLLPDDDAKKKAILHAIAQLTQA